MPEGGTDELAEQWVGPVWATAELGVELSAVKFALFIGYSREV